LELFPEVKTLNDANRKETDFLSHLTSIVEENLDNENFGVSELAGKTGRENKKKPWIILRRHAVKAGTMFPES
jgi:hypothetical protein